LTGCLSTKPYNKLNLEEGEQARCSECRSVLWACSGPFCSLMFLASADFLFCLFCNKDMVREMKKKNSTRKGVLKRRRAKELKELKRLCEEYTHCPSCGVSMSLSGDDIDWEEVRGDPRLTDPCDSCCCGACGQRKRYPGEAHC